MHSFFIYTVLFSPFFTCLLSLHYSVVATNALLLRKRRGTKPKAKCDPPSAHFPPSLVKQVGGGPLFCGCFKGGTVILQLIGGLEPVLPAFPPVLFFLFFLPVRRRRRVRRSGLLSKFQMLYSTPRKRVSCHLSVVSERERERSRERESVCVRVPHNGTPSPHTAPHPPPSTDTRGPYTQEQHNPKQHNTTLSSSRRSTHLTRAPTTECQKKRKHGRRRRCNGHQPWRLRHGAPTEATAAAAAVRRRGSGRACVGRPEDGVLGTPAEVGHGPVRRRRPRAVPQRRTHRTRRAAHGGPTHRFAVVQQHGGGRPRAGRVAHHAAVRRRLLRGADVPRAAAGRAGRRRFRACGVLHGQRAAQEDAAGVPVGHGAEVHAPPAGLGVVRTAVCDERHDRVRRGDAHVDRLLHAQRRAPRQRLHAASCGPGGLPAPDGGGRARDDHVRLRRACGERRVQVGPGGTDGRGASAIHRCR